MNNAGNAVYAILVVVFLIGTYGLALSLESILEQWKRLRRGNNNRWGGGAALSSHHLTPGQSATKSRFSLRHLGSIIGFRKEVEADEKLSSAA